MLDLFKEGDLRVIITETDQPPKWNLQLQRFTKQAGVFIEAGWYDVDHSEEWAEMLWAARWKAIRLMKQHRKGAKIRKPRVEVVYE